MQTFRMNHSYVSDVSCLCREWNISMLELIFVHVRSLNRNFTFLHLSLPLKSNRNSTVILHGKIIQPLTTFHKSSARLMIMRNDLQRRMDQKYPFASAYLYENAIFGSKAGLRHIQGSLEVGLFTFCQFDKTQMKVALLHSFLSCLFRIIWVNLRHF